MVENWKRQEKKFRLFVYGLEDNSLILDKVEAIKQKKYLEKRKKIVIMEEFVLE